MIMKELAAEIRLQPKPEAFQNLHGGGQGASHHSTERQTGLYQFHGCVKRLAAGKGAEGGHRASGRRPLLSMFHLPGRQWACL